MSNRPRLDRIVSRNFDDGPGQGPFDICKKASRLGSRHTIRCLAKIGEPAERATDSAVTEAEHATMHTAKGAEGFCRMTSASARIGRPIVERIHALLAVINVIAVIASPTLWLWWIRLMLGGVQVRDPSGLRRLPGERHR